MTTITAPPIAKLPRDLAQAAVTLGDAEARYLVDLYYQVQDYRKATANQVRALVQAEDGPEEPHETIGFVFGQIEEVEQGIRRALDKYSAAQPMGEWSRQVVGIGPVIAAGLLAHIDIERARTAGAIWRFAGLDPTAKWEKGQRRPWNASLKVLSWKIGDSFKKVSGNPRSFYGHLYRERKEYEVARDVAGGNAETAARTLKEKTFRDVATRKMYESGHLPAGRLDLRAMRYATKMFLAHYHEEGYRQLGKEPPVPYALTMPEHVHPVPSPVPSLGKQ